MNRVDEFFDLTVQLEGGYSDRVSDSGGQTKYGITQYILNEYCKNHNVPIYNVKTLTLENAKYIYMQFFYFTIMLVDNIEVHFNYVDMAFNSGHSHYMDLKKAMTLPVLPENVYDYRKKYYLTLNQPQNIVGWIDRLARIKSHFNPVTTVVTHA